MPGSDESFDALVLGGGQAGLAAGYYLAEAGLRFAVVDAHARIGDSWRRRWDSLHLFTPVFANHLPGMRFVGDPNHLPSKDEVGDYLERYADFHELPTICSTRVRRVVPRDAAFEVRTASGILRADRVIVATGAFRTPWRPASAAELSDEVQQLHASEYANASEVVGERVLVVGAANSGAQIAMELAAAGRHVTLAGRDTGQIPRRILGVDVYRYLGPLLRRRVDSWIGRRVRARMGPGGDPLC